MAFSSEVAWPEFEAFSVVEHLSFDGRRYCNPEKLVCVDEKLTAGKRRVH